MEFKLKFIVLILGLVLTGLTAGLCFTWSNVVTPGIGRLDNLSFLKAFQAMNRAIINGKFMIVFFGPVLLLFLNTYLFKGNNISFWLFRIWKHSQMSNCKSFGTNLSNHGTSCIL